MADSLVIKIDLENGNIDPAFKSIETKANTSGKKAGKSFGTNFTDEITSSIGSIAGAVTKVTAVIGGLVGGFSLIKAIDAAQVQEDAVNNLNIALATTGDYSKEASQEMQNFASSLQQSTKFGDELILQQIAIAKSFGATNQQSKELVEAAANLSAALGISLESAVDQLAGTLNGVPGRLNKIIPEIRNLSQEQLAAGDVIDIVAKKYEGFAANQVNTFSGATAQLKNTIGDVFEEIGLIITKNPLFTKFITMLNSMFQSVGVKIKEFAANFDVFRDIAEPLSTFASGFIQFVVSPIELAVNAYKIFQSFLNSTFAAIIARIGEFAADAANLIQFFAPDSDMAKNLATFAETSKEVFVDNIGELKQSMDSLFDFPIAAKFEAKNEELLASFQEFNQIVQDEAVASQSQFDQALTEKKVALDNSLNDSQKKLMEQLKRTQEATKQIIDQGITRTISGGIQNIVASLARGENAFANFGKFLLDTFGDLSIQLGQFYVAQGIAQAALVSLGAPAQQIAAGAALIALGAILKSFSSGKSSSSSRSSSGGGSSGVAGAGVTPESGQLSSDVVGPESRQEPQTQVAVNINGDVFDSDETGTRLADILSKSFSKKGIVLTDARVRT